MLIPIDCKTMVRRVLINEARKRIADRDAARFRGHNPPGVFIDELPAAFEGVRIHKGNTSRRGSK